MFTRLSVRRTRLWVLPVILLLMAARSSVAQTELKGLGSVGQVQQVQGGFQFLEGPAKTPDGSIYFTDIPAESIYRMDPSGSIDLFLKPSLHANGLMYGGDNRLLACQMDGQLASIDLGTKETTVLTAEYNGQRYNACNDLVVDRTGGIYFTDPRFRAPEPLPQGTEAFYYRSADGQVTRLGSDLNAPNGIALSPDETRLYVIPSMQAQMMVYPVEQPGKIGAGRVLCELEQAGDRTDGGGDGLAIDEQGNLYITSATGIQVFSAEGEMLGTIQVPEQPANCAFGGEANKTLFITARTGFYRCQMPVAGHVQRAK